jgi:formate dehydrogenase major subunit
VARVVLDGSPHDVPDGSTVLDALHAAGLHVPALCADPRLAPVGVCRSCLVEVDGAYVPACTTPVTDGMTVGVAAAESAREHVVSLLHRPHDTGTRPAPDRSLPLIAVDMGECILCQRCIRICADVQGQSVWHLQGRGADTRVVAGEGVPLGDSDCVACGACVDACPTDALLDASAVDGLVAEAWTRTTCPYCGVGCELEAGTLDGRVVAARPVVEAPSSKGHLCVKGRYGFGFVHADDRVTEPLVRRGGTWEPVTWDDAVALVAERLRAVEPGRVAVLGSARATNEEAYLTQKLARHALGTNNVDSCARVCHAPTAAAMGAVLGTGAATGSYDDIEAAGAILVCGANTTESHPVVGARIKQAARRGTPLVVIDPRTIELATYATVHLRPRPGTNVALLNALAHVVLAEGLDDAEYIAQRLDGAEELRSFLTAYSPEAVAAICGVDPDDIRRAARVYAGGRPATSFHGLGLTEHEQGTDGVTCLVNLALLTGNVGVVGGGVNPLRGQNNVQGAAHMGCEPGKLTGFVPLATGRERFETLWGAPLPDPTGLDAIEAIDAAAEGRLDALWVIGWDIALTNPDLHRTRDALGRVGFVVVQDLFLNETASEVADVFLPACSSFEKDGTFMNAERRVQRVRRAVDPLGHSKPDWEILCAVGRALGHADAFAFASPEAVWEEIRLAWPAGAGITYERLDAEGGLQWPCPATDHPGTTHLHRETFTIGERVALRRIDQHPPAEPLSAERPLVLVTGRSLHQFNAGTMTRRSAGTSLRPVDVLEIAEADAAELGIADGSPVRVTSRHGSAVLRAHVGDRVRPGEVFATFNDPATLLNHVIGPARDPITHTPAYKRTPVTITFVG